MPGQTVGRITRGAQPRQNELELPTSYEETDSVLLQLPHGFVPEGALPSASYTADFGSYCIHSVLTGDSLVITAASGNIKASILG